MVDEIFFKFFFSFPEMLAILYFRALWECQACLTTPKRNFMINLHLPWISYYTHRPNFLPHSFWGIKTKKKIANCLVESIFDHNSRTRFFTATWLLEILKGGVLFKIWKSHWRTKSFFKICIANFFQST